MRSGTSLYVLPNIRFGVDHAHVGLIRTPVNQDAIIHLQKSVFSVVLEILFRCHTIPHGEADLQEYVALWWRSLQRGLYKVARQVLGQKLVT
jgi:hypothetical protein